MAKDFTCTQVIVNNGIADCNVEEKIRIEFSFNLKQKLEEEIEEEYAKKVKEAEERTKQELDNNQKKLEEKQNELDQNTKEQEDIQNELEGHNFIQKIFKSKRRKKVKKLKAKLEEQKTELEEQKENIKKKEKQIKEKLVKEKVDISNEKTRKITELPNVIKTLIEEEMKVHFTINESIVVQGDRYIHKPLKEVSPTSTSTATEAFAELVFPEALAGANLQIEYAFECNDRAVNKPTTGLQSNIAIKRADGLKEIEKVYWSEQEHALWGAKLTIQKELCENEVGFLHIYTKGLFGKEITSQITTSSRSLSHIPNRGMRDNVLSIAYTMSDLLARYKTLYPKFKGDTLALTANISTKERTSKTPSTPIGGKKSDGTLTLKCKQTAVNPQQSTSDTEVKVLITTDEEAIPTYTKAQCILQFRPKKDSIPTPSPSDGYRGDYGFDWIRTGDTGPATPPPINAGQIPTAAGYHNDFAYEDFMGVHYHNAPHTDWTNVLRPSTNQIEHDGNQRGNTFKYDKNPNTGPEVCRPDFHYNKSTKTWAYTPSTGADTAFGMGKMYNKLKLRYKRLIFNWDPNATGVFLETYAPIMTIMNGKVANLDLYLDIKNAPKKIIFKFHDSSADTFLTLDKTEINSNLSATMAAGTASVMNKTAHTLKITCNGEFDREHTLLAYACKQDVLVDGNTIEDKKGEVCAILRILPNATKYQRKIKIIIFNVKSNFNGTTNEGKNMYNNSIDEITKLFAQALTIPTFEYLDIDTTSDNHFKDKCSTEVNINLPLTGIVSGEYALDANKSGNIVPVLEKKRILQHGHAHDNSIKLYFVEEIMPAKDSTGNWKNGSWTSASFRCL